MHLLLISGSTRSASTNTATLRTVAALGVADVRTRLYGDLALLPAFNPDHDMEPLPDPVAQLRRAIAAADAVLFCTPEYAGSLPGSLKNLLDWTVSGGEMYGKPVAWLNVAAQGRGSGAHSALATVLGYVGADVVTPACRAVPVARQAVGPDGLVDVGLRAQLAEAVGALVTAVGRTARDA